MIVRAEPVMGTVVSFRLAHGEAGTRALDDAIAWLHEVDERFSPYHPDSEVSRLADGRLTETGAHPDVREVLALVDEAAVDSDGAFDARRAPLSSRAAYLSVYQNVDNRINGLVR